MQPGPPGSYHLTCARCGAGLELPADLTAVQCNCPYCGLDNVLPEQLLKARRQQLHEIQRQHPAREMRLVYCPTRAGVYELAVKPSTPDHYAFAGVDCPRDGSEGLARERELRAARDSGGKPN